MRTDGWSNERACVEWSNVLSTCGAGRQVWRRQGRRFRRGRSSSSRVASGWARPSEVTSRAPSTSSPVKPRVQPPLAHRTLTPLPSATPYTLHLPYTLHPPPYTLHPTPYALHGTRAPTPFTPRHNTLHPTPYTLCPGPDALPCTPYPAHASTCCLTRLSLKSFSALPGT